MDTVLRVLNKANLEFGKLTSQLDSTGWVILAVSALLIGLVLLRGNPLRSN